MKEDKELIQIRGSGGGKGGSANSTLNADDNMFSRQSASFVDILSEGPIKGLVYGESSVFFDDTRMRDINLATGEVSKDANFQNFVFITKDGSAEQTVNADFFNEFPTSSVVEAKSGAALQYNEPQYFTLSTSAFEKTNADYIKVNIYTNGMQLVILEDDPSSDVGYLYQNYSKGDIVGSYVDFDIEFRYIKADGTIVEKNLFDGVGGARNQAAGTGFSGKCSSKYVQTYGMNIEDIKNSDGFVDWAIKVTRKSPHETDASVKRMDDIFVESIEVSIADKLEYPYSAYVAGVFDAENFSAIPKRAYEIDGRIIDVPTNYVPCDYNGRKIKVEDVNASNHVFVVGETITDIKATLSSIHVEGNADNGYTATATTAAAHGLTIGKTFLVKITGVTGDNATFFNVDPAFATVTSTTNYTYVLETGTEALTGVTDDTSTAVPGTIVATYIWGGAVIDKIDATNDYLYLRDTGAQYTPITGATVTGGTSGAVTTISSDGTIELAFIPANYRRNPSTELITAQDQDWDGLYYSSWTNNPAWVFKDMLNNKVYGLGNYVTESEINKWELFSIGKYCDELVPAGIKAADFLSIYTTSDTNYIPAGSSGEYEPRFTSNLVLRSKAEAFKVINDMVTIFRGIIYWLNGELYVVQDSEKDPIYQFTNANVMGGEFTYEGSSFKTRTNQVIVKWNNPQDMYRQREEYIESEEILQQDTEFLKPATMVAFGCTSRGQARRLGKWKLLTEKLNTNTVSFKTALNATFLQPGDIIRIIDKRKQGVSWGGRISSGTDLNTFVLDREFAIESGYTAADYEVIVTYSTSKALLAQDNAEIDIGGSNTDFVRGDIITQVGDGSTVITTQALSQQVQDTDNNNVAIQWTPSHHTEKSTLQSIDSTTDGRTTLSVATDYTATPVAEEVWLIQRTSLSTGKEELKAQLYRIITIQEAEKNTFEIGALEYNASKFDAVDKNEVIESYKTYNLPNSLDTVPPPTNLGFEVSTRLLSDGINVNTLSLFWDEPQDDEGRPYTFVQNYLVEYSTDDNLYIAAGYTQGTSFEITDIPSGQYYFRVYTVNIQGKKSVKATLDTGLVTFQQATPQDDDGIGNQPFTINTTGTLPDSNLSLNTTTGLVSFSPTSFDYRAFGVTTSVSSQGNLDFSDLDDGETGYIYFDKSISKFLAIRWDSTGDSFYKVDEDPFATATGTIQHTGGSTTRTVTGSNTDFDAELGIYNKLKVTVSNVDYYPRVLRFSTTSPNTILVLNEPFAVNVPASTAFSKPTFLANYNTDSIFGEVTRTNSSTYSIALHGPIKGEDSYSINGTNENHSFTADASGNVDDFDTFTNDYTVIKGASIYSYAANGIAASTFGLNKSDSNCTTVIDASTGQITCSALTQVAGKTTVTITDRASAATIATRIISFSKSLTGAGGSGSNAKTVKLTPNYHVLNYEQNDTESTTITFATEVQNTAGTVYYEFLVDGSAPTGGAVNGTTTTFTLPQGDEPAIGGAVNVKVKIRETSTSAAVIATDTVTIYAVQDGSNAVIALLTNQAHVVSASTDGTLASGALDDAGGTYKVFVGATDKTTGNSVVYSKVSNTGCTAAINSSTGVYTISAVASDQATAVFQAVVPAAATGSIEVTHTADYSISKSKVGTTGDTTYTWIKYGTDINGANLTNTYVAGTTTYIGHAYNKTTATESTDPADYTWSRLEGDVGLKTANGYLYYNTQQASAPSAPSNSSVVYTFSSGLLSGGVIGSGATNWNQNAPAATGGASGSKMYYVYWSTTEATAEGGIGTTVTLGSTVYTATNFVGLVKFSGTNTIVDGSGGTISLGSGGTTTIDGDAITTGTVDAARIDTDLLRITGTNFTGEHQGGEVGGWTLASDAIYSGTKDTTGYTGSNGHITICSSGSIHTPAFFVETDGTAGFKGTVTIGGTDLTSGNTLNENTVGGDLGGGYGDNSIGGLTLAADKIYIGTGTFGNANTPFYVDNGGDFSLKDKLTWDQSTGTLAINGNITMNNQSSIDISGFDNDSGFTDDSAADDAQGDADIANNRAQNFDTSGDIADGISVGTSGHIKGGQSAYNNGSGFFLGYSGSAYKFSIGDSSSNKLTWDGTTLTVAGSITVGDIEDGEVGGWEIDSSTISSDNITLDSTNNRILISD